MIPPELPLRRPSSDVIYQSVSELRNQSADDYPMLGRPLPPTPLDQEFSFFQNNNVLVRQQPRIASVFAAPPSVQNTVTLVRTIQLGSYLKGNWVTGLAYIKKDALLLVDLRNIHVVNSSGAHKRTIGAKGNSMVSKPISCAILHNGHVAVADQAQQVVKIFTPKGAYVRTLSSPAGVAGLAADHKRKTIITCNPDKGCLTVFDETGNIKQRIPAAAKPAANSTQLKHPICVANSPLTGDVIVGDDAMEKVVAFSYDGRRLWDFAPREEKPLERKFFPSSITIDREGYIFVADLYNEKIFMLDSCGSLLRTILSKGCGLRSSPVSIATNGDGCLAVIEEQRTIKVFRYRENGFVINRRFNVCENNSPQ